MTAFTGKRILMLLGPQYEDKEGSEPIEIMTDAGAVVDVVGLEKGPLKGKNGIAEIDVKFTINEVNPIDYAALVIPGGKGPENLRKHPETIELVKGFASTGRPIAAICHGPQMLASAGVLKGRIITGWPKIRKEMEDAGAVFTSHRTQVDGNLITAQGPKDVVALVGDLEEALG